MGKVMVRYDRASSCRISHLHGSIHAGKGEELAVRGPGQDLHGGSMTLIGRHLAPGDGIPYLYLTIIGRQNPPTLGRRLPGTTQSEIRECQDGMPGNGIPYPYLTIIGHQNPPALW